MSAAKHPQNVYPAYHAHVYFDQTTLPQATELCRQAGELFTVEVGRVHRKNVGPHPRWSCQLSFDRDEFEQIIPWLEQHRAGLSILVHGLTGDDLADHTTHAAWLGEKLLLNLAVFKPVKAARPGQTGKGG